MKPIHTLTSQHTHGWNSSLLQPVAAMVAITMVAGAAFAQQRSQLSPITVEASHPVQKKQVGVSYAGIPIEQVKLSRQVGYDDLNLGTPAGAAALEKRIKITAEEACKQLRTLYPLESWDSDNATCVEDAVNSAMRQERSMVIATQRGH